MPPDDLQRQLVELLETIDPATPAGTSETVESRATAQEIVQDFIRRERPDELDGVPAEF